MKKDKSPDNFQNTMLTTDLFGPYFTNYISKESVMPLNHVCKVSYVWRFLPLKLTLEVDDDETILC
jgi:hypothetical protein